MGGGKPGLARLAKFLFTEGGRAEEETKVHELFSFCFSQHQRVRQIMTSYFKAASSLLSLAERVLLQLHRPATSSSPLPFEAPLRDGTSSPPLPFEAHVRVHFEVFGELLFVYD